MILYEYQSFSTAEFPDVLVYYSHATSLFEIKISRQDFLADARKEAREKYRPKGYLHFKHLRGKGEKEKLLLQWANENPELYYIEKPHLGFTRYYVCEAGLISPDEVPKGWGLYWVAGNKFSEKVRSGKWRPDVHAERNILVHALRKYANGETDKILVAPYKYLTDKQVEEFRELQSKETPHE